MIATAEPRTMARDKFRQFTIAFAIRSPQRLSLRVSRQTAVDMFLKVNPQYEPQRAEMSRVRRGDMGFLFDSEVCIIRLAHKRSVRLCKDDCTRFLNTRSAIE